MSQSATTRPKERPHVEPWPDDYSDGDHDRYVFVTLPTCPSCGSGQHRIYRTDSDDDGSKTQWALCKGCEHKFQIVWEFPQDGITGAPLC